jgi:hypothetical protein
MKNRFVGEITVTFADGYVEECMVKERVDKGKQHFLDMVREYSQLILKEAPKDGHVKLNYKGDFAREIAECMGEHACMKST